MDEYPNSDEEFELMYGDEFELLREQEENLELHEPHAKSRKSLDFKNHSKQLSAGHTSSQQTTTSAYSQHVRPSTSKSFASEFQSLDDIQIVEDEQQTAVREMSSTPSTKKRSIQELFGEIDDILNEEIADGRVKKRKNCYNDDFALIDHILELRKLAKERHNPVGVLSKDYALSNGNHNKENISFRVPRYSFVVVTRNDGERIYVRCHSEEYEREEIKKVAKKGSFTGVMGESFKEIWNIAREQINKNLDKESCELTLQGTQTNSADMSILKESTMRNTHLWVDLYKPQKYLELLSDESTNRILLRWLKLWDKVVFNRKPKPKMVKIDKKELNNKFQNIELRMNLDENGRPEHKVVLLCGPPGLGKTTLAHMVAKHAGYNVVEVNASDDRSTEKFKTVLETATQMRSVIDQENRPNCLVFDEIDGAPSSSIEFLIKFINGTATTKKKKGIKQNSHVLKRPIICICNDVYVPALRPLRQIAFVVNFPPTASARLAERLNEIARHQKIKTDLGALLALCEKSGNDIRSCLSVLHFFKSLSKPITLSHVYKTSIGQKDIQKGLFAVWQEIFQIQRQKHKIMCNERDDSNKKDNTPLNDMSLRYRMQKILQVVNAFGDYERLAQGIFENYPNMKVRDTSLTSVCEALEWFCFTDVVNNQIHTVQNYTLSSYLPFAFVIWHYVFASLEWQKLKYPSAGYEARMKASKNVALLTEVMKGMQPSVRAFTYSSSLRLDTLPILSQIILPLFRPVNLHLYTQQEREQLNKVVSVMIEYNLNYVQERMPEGNYVYNIDPNIEEITSFHDTKPKRVLSYSNKQLISREIEVEKMRRMEMHKSGEFCKDSSKAGFSKNKEKGQKQQLPNHLQRLKPKTVKPKSESVVTKDFFDRTVTKSTVAGKLGPELKNDIWYQFKEGYNNAVRKRIKISSLK